MKTLALLLALLAAPGCSQFREHAEETAALRQELEAARQARARLIERIARLEVELALAMQEVEAAQLCVDELLRRRGR